VRAEHQTALAQLHVHLLLRALCLQANNIASFQTGNPVTATTDEALVTIDVTGCNVYTPIGNGTSISMASRKRLAGRPAEQPVEHAKVVATAKASAATKVKASSYSNGKSSTSCLSSVVFWRSCMNSSTPSGRCAVINQLPAGPNTPFFPQAEQKATRTYKNVMLKSSNSGVKATDMWFKASQALVAAQLNELAGVTLPVAAKEAMSTISNVVLATTATPPQLPANLPGLPAAISTLEKLLSGQSGVPVC